jgi:hypothetical protein
VYTVTDGLAEPPVLVVDRSLLEETDEVCVLSKEGDDVFVGVGKGANETVSVDESLRVHVDVIVSVLVCSCVVLGELDGDAEKSCVFMERDVDGLRVTLIVLLRVRVMVTVSDADRACWLSDCDWVPVIVTVVDGVGWDDDTVTVAVMSSVRLCMLIDNVTDRLILISFVSVKDGSGDRESDFVLVGFREIVFDGSSDRVTDVVVSGVSVRLPVRVAVSVDVGVTE